MPALGDLVSLRLDNPEPIMLSSGRAEYIRPQFVRGRLGALPLLDDLADAVTALPVGERRIVTTTFPADWPHGALRGKRRVLALTLLAAKPFRKPYGLA